MILIVSSQGNTLESKPNPRFGRSQIFIKFDLASNTWEALANPAASERGGAGVAASQFVIDQGASAAISGSFGPNAYQALHAAGIQMWTFNNHNTVQEVIDAFITNTLTKIAHPG